MVVPCMVMLRQYGVGYDRLAVHCVGAGTIQCYGIERSEHPDVRYDSRVIFCMAVAIRGDIHYQADVKTGTAVNHSLCIFRNFFI